VSAIPDAPELLIPPARHGRHGKLRKDGKPSESKSDGLRAAMTAKLTSEHGRVCYAQRSRWFAVNGRSNLQHLWATGSYASRRRRRAAAERGARHLARRPEPAASEGSGGRGKSLPAAADASRDR
jgi:hypothetical protein